MLAKVTAVSEVSISLNVWANGGIVERVQQLQRSAAEHFGLVQTGSTRIGVLDHSWTLQARSVLLEHAAQQLVARTLNVSAERARSWLRTNMRSRWASVTKRFPKPLRKLARFCNMTMRGPRYSMLQNKLVSLPNDESKLILTTIEQAASSAAFALRNLPAGATELEMGNLVEQLALDVLGDVKVCGSFLVHCFEDT